ncbi:MAG: 2-C-methyl-D-erythritol 4-phosphate cytidylyltransferase, partial [Actinomycetota bacterium]
RFRTDPRIFFPMSPVSTVTAVLLAAGSGERVGSGSPKQFLPLAGEPMVIHSLRTLDACPAVDSIVIALPFDRSGWPREMEGFAKVAAYADGGPTRQNSLARALEHLPEDAPVVMVHDASRPLLTGQLLRSLLGALDDSCDGVIPAIPLEDTIKRVSTGMFVTEQLDRNGVWRVQTPQIFRREALVDALTRAIEAGLEATDCSHMLTLGGYRVKVVPGDPQNFKVTRPGDLAWAEAVLASRTVPPAGGRL